MNHKTTTLMSLGISIALIAAGIWFLCNHQNNLAYGQAGWAMPFHMMGGSGMGMVMILFWIAVISAVGLVISGVIWNQRHPDHKGNVKACRTTNSTEHRNT